MAEGVKITVEDLENPGSRPEVVVIVDNYFVLTHGECAVASEQHYPTTGTVQLTIKRRPRDLDKVRDGGDN